MTLSPVQGAANALLYDVIVVGCGPVGAVAACLLGHHGLSTLIVDRSHTIYDKPRALALDHEIARILQGIGLGDAIKPHVAPFTPAEYFGVDGQLIKRLDMLPPPYPLGWIPSMVFMQPAIETLLRERMTALSSITAAFGLELIGLSDEPECIVAQLRDASGAVQTVRGRYLVGCDGASSTVRTLAGITLDDLGFDQSWLVVDVLANDGGLARLPKITVHYCEPERPTSFLIGTGRHRRWEFKLRPGEDPRVMESPDQVWPLLRNWIEPSEAELWRSASYRFHALVAHDWRRGRVFVAGDAAHQQPPYLGQGLCQGIRDVANLAWKFERVLKGRSGDSLLDTYGIERASHVRRLHSVIIGIGEIIGESDGDAARARDARLIAEAGGTVQSVPRQNFQPALDSGCIGSKLCAGQGTLFPQPAVRRNHGDVLLDDVTGAGGRVILDRGFPRLSAPLRLRLEALDLTLVSRADEAEYMAELEIEGHMIVEVDTVLETWFRTNACAAAVVRPDHYVFATASNEAELTATLDEYALALAFIGDPLRSPR
jgi:3-(3-hydroxy-phenyl)propionate hydroxylase